MMPKSFASNSSTTPAEENLAIPLTEVRPWLVSVLKGTLENPFAIG